jgi:hypothetical protein
VSSTEERDNEARHQAAMQIVEDTALAFKRGAVSFNRAKSIIDDALIGDADRIVRVGNKHTPEIET